MVLTLPPPPMPWGGAEGGRCSVCVCCIALLVRPPLQPPALAQPCPANVLTQPPAAMPRQVGALVLEAFPPRGIVHPMVEKEKTEVGQGCWGGVWLKLSSIQAALQAVCVAVCLPPWEARSELARLACFAWTETTPTPTKLHSHTPHPLPRRATAR